MAVVVGGLGAGLYLFSSYQEFLASFRWYHLRSYGLALGHTTQTVERYTAAAALTLTKGEQLRYVRDDITPAQSIPVLLYHGVMAESDGNNIALKQFTDQLLALKAAGYQTVALDDFAQFMRGDKDLPNKSFLLTFDDGRKDSYYPVDPLLKALDYNAVMYAITGRSLGAASERSTFYLSERELRSMLKTGRWEIQSHGKDDHDLYAIDSRGTQGHFLSNRLYLREQGRVETVAEFSQRIYRDLLISRQELEKALGTPVISFAYPFGDFGQSSVNFPDSKPIIAEAASALYALTFYQGWPGLGDTFNYPDRGAFMIKRIDVKPTWSGEHLVSLLEQGRAKSLPYTDDFVQDQGWIKTWGRLAITEGALGLGSHATTTGALAFLDGTGLWRDYLYEAEIGWQRGQSVSLLARFQDGENFVSCTFTDAGVRIEERVNGINRIVATSTLELPILKHYFTPAISVAENTTACLIGDELVASGSGLTPSLRHGGIGLKTWDPVPGQSTIRVQHVRAVATSSALLAKSPESL